jgi:hypothetical protein
MKLLFSVHLEGNFDVRSYDCLLKSDAVYFNINISQSRVLNLLSHVFYESKIQK